MHLRLGTSTYSYWHFTPEKVPIETVLESAHELGLHGVEILHRQMASEDPTYLRQLKQRAFQLGLALYNLSIHQDFVWADKEARQRHVAHTLHCIDLAHELGIPSLRINSGGWRKQGGFDDLLASKGWVEPWPGHTQEEGFAWVCECIHLCLAQAEAKGVTLLLENHWGLTTFAQDMKRILLAIDSPWLGAILDMGNFLFEEDMYAAMQCIAGHVQLAHMKTYPGGGSWYALDLDYARVFSLLLKAGFTGYVSIEMEGQDSVTSAMPFSIRTARAAWQAALASCA